MIDNIRLVDVYRNIDVDLPDNYISNLELNQIQRLMKLKNELQNPAPELGDIQTTLKRFIVDLDVKEAYEFSIVNPFLINEEDLATLINDLKHSESATHNPALVLDVENKSSDSEEEEDEDEQPGV